MSGKTLGHYEMLELIGRGGMGEVHLARDTKLGREVALKLLPIDFASDTERLARFRREAKVLASLNHPNIAGIHGLEEEGGQHFLVMELAEGEDLEHRLKRGALPVEECLKIALQIAEGVEEAHEKNVIHRDLKPANVMLSSDGKVKILDFGLARAYAGESDEDADPAKSPTITAAMTQQGVILGTAAYMSPEQARGKTVDRRADIWAFGAILFELLSGQRLFQGETVSDTLASVLAREPKWELLPNGLSLDLHRLLKRCLQRERNDRLNHIGDARLTIQEILSGEDSGVTPAHQLTESGSSRPLWPWMIATALFAALAAIAFFLPSGDGSSQLPLRKSAITLSTFAESGGVRHDPSISPDGGSVVYVHRDKLWILDLHAITPRSLEGTEGARNPFWSPDSEWIGFLVGRDAYKMARSGGVPILIGQLRAIDGVGSVSAGAWNESGLIAIGTGIGDVLQLPAHGGEVTSLVPTGPGITDYHGVCALPESRGWIVVVHREEGGFGFLDLVLPDGTQRTLVDMPDQNFQAPVYAPSGHLLFQRSEGTAGIWAIEFDLNKLETRGVPFLVAPNAESPSVSEDGTLSYLLAAESPPAELTRVDRESGTVTVLSAVNTNRPFPFLSNDENSIALTVQFDTSREIVIFDALQSGRERRITFTDEEEEMASFSPNDQTLFAYMPGPFRTVGIPLDATDQTFDVGPGIMAQAYGDGDEMVIAELQQGSFNFDVVHRSVDSENPNSRKLVESPGIDWWPQVSPNEDYLLYSSDESGTMGVYLTTFPDTGTRWEVSKGPGDMSRWSGDGSEIYFAQRDAIMVVEVDQSRGLRLGTPQKVMDRRPVNFSDMWFDGFDVSADGQTFFVVQAAVTGESQPTRLVVVQNWVAEFSR